MIIKKFLLSALFVLSLAGLKAQDLHFTYFEMSPLTFNPAQTGAFNGTIRLSGHYRGQWMKTGGYTTPAFSLDSPFMKGFRKYDWIGGGISFASDNAGSLGLKTSVGGLNAAYHFAFDKNYSRVFSVGIKYGTYGRKVNNGFNAEVRNEDASAIISAIDDKSAFEGTSVGGFLPTGQDIETNSKSDYALGFLYKAIPDKISQFEIGLSLDHLTFPRTSLGRGAGGTDGRPSNCAVDDLREECQIGVGNPVNPGNPGNGGVGQGTNEDRDRRHGRVTSTINYTRYLNKKLRLSPGAMVQFTTQGFEAQFHAIAGYLIDPKKGTVVNGGLGFRAIGIADAQLFFGLEMKDLKVGAAFDLGLAGFQQAPGFQSAFEIGATYIIKIYKDPEVDPVIFCPRF